MAVLTFKVHQCLYLLCYTFILMYRTHELYEVKVCEGDYAGCTVLILYHIDVWRLARSGASSSSMASS